MKNNGTELIERKARIFNIQKYNMYDGPGVRTLVFFQGCPLRCKWCANPEGLEKKYKIMFKKDNCINCGKCVDICETGVHTMDGNIHCVDNNKSCIGCGKCISICPKSALNLVGKDMKISELLDIIEEDRIFYETSGGGVTLGGGEVLMQPEAAISLLMACKDVGINTAIETCGYTTSQVILKAAEFADLFLFDIKHIDSDKHLYWTGVRNEQILENLDQLLKNRYNVQIRMPLLKGVNDDPEDLKKLMELLEKYRGFKNFKGIDLLPYHKMGINKYKQLGKEYSLKNEVVLNDEDLNRIESLVKKYDLPVKVIRH